MRIVDVVLASVLLGLTLGLVHTGTPARASGHNQVTAVDCGQSACRRFTWLRTPLMRRATASE